VTTAIARRALASLHGKAPAARVATLAAAFAVAALILDRSALHLPWRLDLTDPWLWALLALFAGCEFIVLHVEIGKNAYSLSFSEIPFTLALFFAPPASLVVARLVGGGLALAVGRRQRPLKLAFNLSTWLMECTLALLVFAALDGARATRLVEAWPAAAAASLAGSLFISLAVTAAIFLTSGTYRTRLLLQFVQAGILTCAAGCVAALFAWGALRWDGAEVWPLLALTGVLFAAYRGYTRLHQRHVNLELLYDFTRRLSRSDSGEDVLVVLLAQVRTLLRAETAEITMLGSDVPTRWRLSGELPAVDEPCTLEADDWPLSRVLTEEKPLVIPSRTRDGALRRYLTWRGFRDCVIVPLHGESGVAGTLAVADRLGEVATFTADDGKLLQTVANQAVAALENSRLLERLSHDSRHDALTGLANRSYFNEAVERALHAADPTFAVLLMDLDRFKEVNDTLGHHHGDLLLLEVAKRLSAQVRRGDMVARLGGDEFAVLLHGATADGACRVARDMLATLAAPLTLEGVSLEVKASIGVAACPVQGRDASVLLRRADVAMYAAKRSQGGLEVYDAVLDSHSPRRLALASELRSAIESGDLVLRFQPQVAVDGTPVAAEALVRWQHEKFGLLAPDEFVPIAEQTAQIRDLTEWVLGAALTACRDWRSRGVALGVAVNLSVRNLLDAGLPGLVQRLLAESGVPAAELTLEITETHLMADPPRTMRVVNELARMGVRLAIDDFGTGYSSLAYLKSLPVRDVKIDKSFVFRVAVDETDQAIVRSIVDLAHSLGLAVVAEGVEDEATLRVLAHVGCDLVQGYHLSRPVPVDQLVAWVRARELAGAAVRGIVEPRLPSHAGVRRG
jgi:diguanylate cyclase (GGDEF)-like protein